MSMLTPSLGSARTISPTVAAPKKRRTGLFNRQAYPNMGGAIGRRLLPRTVAADKRAAQKRKNRRTAKRLKRS
jgi:hypothetical protein